ncbi:MAG: response regulator [Verrucomicrobia bacterium]|jgi:two-component system, sensor histidine kinase and response regulator|nr:response regulator [Verrucomicrobiota bacterium]MBT7067379.1 response regulator [Verrucomicrobiota bacterium]MBT7700006.1 response regulator [Verrucomicrobiota bacterium]
MEPLQVLIVDDERGMREGIKRTLRGFQITVPDIEGAIGFELREAETGEAAIEMIQALPADILLVDHKLPGMTGLDLLARTADEAGDRVAIMIAASASTDTAVAATKQGAYDFLPKPFSAADLRHALRHAATGLVLARRARELEAEKKQVRFEFIRVLGHELKAPISAVMGYLYLLRDRSLGDELPAYDELVGRSVLRLDQMTKMIRDLLDMTRMESGRLHRSLEDVDLVGCIRDALDVGKEEAGRRGITVELHAPSTMPMRADRGEIDMVLNNLISNAVKYNRDEGRVDITVTRAEETITLAVADTGVGMTPKERDRLFGEFVRIKNAKTRNTLGSGLGLSILKRVVELYEGTITVESEADVGSTFTVTLKDAVDEPVEEEDAT